MLSMNKPIQLSLLFCLCMIILSQFVNIKAFADDYSEAVIKAENNSLATNRSWMTGSLQTITGPGDGNAYINVKGQNMVVTKTFLKESIAKYYAAGSDIKTYGNPQSDATWITVGNSLKNYWQTNRINNENVQPETARALGMNTTVTNNAIMEYLVIPDNDHIQRPTKNPDITSYNNATAPIPRDNFVRPPGITDQKYNDFMAYYNNWKSTAYSSSKFPWTQYGYTYRWGYGDSLKNITGLSEFVILGGTNVRVNGIYSIQSYLYTNGNGSGDFNVTGGLDTLWAGRKFQPTGTTINISKDATVAGGEGILISSPGYTINNAGQIVGSTLQKFSIPNTDNVGILFQGIIPTSPNVDPLPNFNNVINNTGRIISPGTAIRADSGNTIINSRNGYISGDKYAILTKTGNDSINLYNSTIKGKIDLGTGFDTININPGSPESAPSEYSFIFNPNSSAPIVNVEAINVNDNWKITPLVSQFVPNNQKYTYAPGVNVTVAPGKSIIVSPDNMPMLTFRMDPSNTVIISNRDLSWYSRNALNKSLGQTIDYISSQGGGTMANTLYKLDTSAVPGNTILQLEPINLTGAFTSAFYSSVAFADSFTDRLRRLREHNSFSNNPPPSTTTGFNTGNAVILDQKIGKYFEAFANGYGYKEWFRSTGSNPGYDSITGGYISGIGARLGSSSNAGLIFGISGTDTDYNNTATGINDTVYRVGGYTSLNLDRILNVDALCTYGYHSTDTNRSIAFLNKEAGADYKMNEFLGVFGLSKMINLKRGFHIYPHVNLQYFFLNRPGYTETGADSVNLIVNSNKYNSLLTRLGGSVIKDFIVGKVVIRPDLKLEYIRECLDPRKLIITSFASFPNNQFETTPGGVDFNNVRIGAGLSIFSAKSKYPVSIYIRNDTLLGKRGVFNAITAGLRLAIP